MENKILEELNRVKLLSFYNTNLTLSENHNLIGDINIILEQGRKTLQTALKADTALAKSMADEINLIFKDFKGGITSSEGVALKTGDDIVNALKNGKLAQTELGKVNTNLFRKTTNPAIKTAIAKDMIESTKFLNTMGKSKNEQEAITNLMIGEKKFTQEEAEFLVREYKNTGRGFGQSTLGAGKTTATVSKKVKTNKRTRKPANSKSTFKNWKKRFGKRWKSMSRIQKILAIAGAGLGVYLLWRYFKDEDPGVFNDCVLSYVTDEDLALMAQQGFGDGIIITDVPNRQVVAMGGIKLFTNGKLESVSGGINGTWSSNGSSINVVIGEQTFNIPCSKETIPDTDDGSVDPGTSRYTYCPGPEFNLYCKNDLIKKVQGCLGIKVDGYLGPLTQQALSNVGVQLPLTQDGINKVCSQQTTTQQTEVNPYDNWEPNEPETGEASINKQETDTTEG